MDDMYSRMGNAILKEIRAFDKEYKDKTISEDYVQWYEQDENELGVISDPQFKSDDLAEKEKKYFEHYNTKDIISSQYSNLNEVEQYFRWEEDKYIFNSIPQNGFNIEWEMCIGLEEEQKSILKWQKNIMLKPCKGSLI